MFLGRYEHNIDDKGRLTIPARFREPLEEGAYLTQGFDKNLIVLTPAAFEAWATRVNSLNMTDPTTRLLRRLIFSSANFVEVDKAGRILIPQYLRQAADLNDNAIVVGAGEFFEIWSPAQWQPQGDMLNDADTNAQRFAALDLTIR